MTALERARQIGWTLKPRMVDITLPGEPQEAIVVYQVTTRYGRLLQEFDREWLADALRGLVSDEKSTRRKKR